MAFERHGGDNGIRVLVVDDDDAIRQLLRLVLEDDGYTVVEARDGAEALDILRRSSDNAVVVTNHHMPVLDGPGLISAVLADPDLRGRVALMYMTAADRLIPPALLQELEALRAPILRKPFELEKLLEEVARGAERLSAVVDSNGDAGNL